MKWIFHAYHLLNTSEKKGSKRADKLLAALLVILLAGCAALGGMAEREKIYGKEVPVIAECFASKQVIMGENWRMYINASDADGDMDQINFSIDQPGVYPAYPTTYLFRGWPG